MRRLKTVKSVDTALDAVDAAAAGMLFLPRIVSFASNT